MSRKISALFSFDGALALSLYMTTGPFLILMNNYILNGLFFKYPMMLSSLGILSSALIVHVLVLLNVVTIREEIRSIVDVKFLITHIGTLGLFQSLALNFGNLVYLYLSVSLIQMLKAFTPVVTMILAFMTNQDTPNPQLIGAVSVLSVGTVITTANVSESDSSLLGFFIMLASVLAQGLKAVLSQKLMQGISVEVKHSEVNGCSADGKDTCDHENQTFIERKTVAIDQANVKFTVFEGLYYYAPVTFLCQCCVSLPMEYRDFQENYDRNIHILMDHWLKFAICGCLGFAVNFGGFLVTKVSSGLYLTALGTIRNIVLVFVSALLFHEIITLKQGIGYVISLIGFVGYNYVKMQLPKSTS